MHIRTFGEGPPLVALHGFTLTGAHFESLAARIRRTISAPDLAGHGGSATEPSDFTAVVDSVVAHLESFGDPLPLLGHSQGGRVAIGVAVRRPELVSHLILISATAGIDDDDVRATRKADDIALADRIVELGLEAFLDWWTADGLTSTASLPPEVRRRDLDVRRENTAQGLASAIRGYGQGSQPVLWDHLYDVRVPALVVAGERDARYTAIAERLQESLPNATLRIVPESGHGPLLAQPDITAELVSGFLDGER